MQSHEEPGASQDESATLDMASFTSSIFLPWVWPFSSAQPPLVKTTVMGVEVEMPVDTGSTGTIIGASILPCLAKDQGTPAHQYYTSSKILYVGRLVDLPLVFHGQNGQTAETEVPVLVVDKSYKCYNYDPARHGPRCPPGPDGQEVKPRARTSIMFMGVGFGRSTIGSDRMKGCSARNPFLNMKRMNRVAIESARHRAGYIVSAHGVEVGLTEANTDGFIFESLDAGATHAIDRRDWAMPRVTFQIDGGIPNQGYGLVDTGVAQMYIRPADSVHLPVIQIPNPRKQSMQETVNRVKSGTTISMTLGNHQQDSPYEIVVGEPSIMALNYVVPATRTSPPFINTGRNFLFGFSVAFDADNGRFGSRKTPVIGKSGRRL